jgi:hypothetical protein
MATSKDEPQVWDMVANRLVKEKIFPHIINRMLFWGPPRTGKSSWVRTLFPRYEQITFHRQMPVDDLLGGYALEDGTTKWQYGPLPRAMMAGCPIVCDEIDQFSPEVRCVMHPMLDDPPAITLANGERIEAKAGYCVIGTTNALPTALPDAVYDRFDIILKADTLIAGLQEALGEYVEPAKNVVNQNYNNHWWRHASVNLFLAASKLRSKGFSEDEVIMALGLQGQVATDFLTVTAKWRTV